jgi:hypothetical protein
MSATFLVLAKARHAMSQREEPTFKDTDSDVPTPTEEDIDRDTYQREETPEEYVRDAEGRRFDTVEDANLPPDTPHTF